MRPFLKTHQTNQSKIRRNFVIRISRRAWSCPANLVKRCLSPDAVANGEGRPTREQIIQSAAQRVDIGKVRCRSEATVVLLRGHVVRRAESLLLAGQLNVPIEQLRKTEIRQPWVSRFIKQNVLRLDVTVQDAALVSRVTGISRFGDDRSSARRVERARPRRAVKVVPRHPLHGDARDGVRSPNVEHAHDPGMIQPRQRLGFQPKPLKCLRMLPVLSPEALDGNRLAGLG